MPERPERSADSNAGRHLILYDGLCGLCNRLNQFVLPRDSRGTFVFAFTQSRVGRELVTRFGRNPDDLDTFFVISHYRSYSARLLSKSSAALFVAGGELDAPWNWLRVFGVLPGPLRDWGYDLIARNRYRVLAGTRAVFCRPRNTNSGSSTHEVSGRRDFSSIDRRRSSSPRRPHPSVTLPSSGSHRRPAMRRDANVRGGNHDAKRSRRPRDGGSSTAARANAD